jgi:hypothetical protein
VNRRLRTLAERPLGQATGRIVVLLGGAVCVGFAVLVGLGLLGPAGAGSPTGGHYEAPSPAAARSSLAAGSRSSDGTRVPARPAQDPQDRPGSTAARRARRELASHRALQHLPYRHGGVSISLVGARGARAVLRVAAATVPSARHGWRSFLRRFRDDGRSYLPRFRMAGSGHGREGSQ